LCPADGTGKKEGPFSWNHELAQGEGGDAEVTGESGEEKKRRLTVFKRRGVCFKKGIRSVRDNSAGGIGDEGCRESKITFRQRAVLEEGEGEGVGKGTRSPAPRDEKGEGLYFRNSIGPAQKEGEGVERQLSAKPDLL